MGRLIVWALREYDEIDPIILSGEFSAEITLNQDDQPLHVCLTYGRKLRTLVALKPAGVLSSLYLIVCLWLFPFSVNEEDEVAIKDAVYMIADALDFKGKIEVSFQCSQGILDPK